LPQPAWLSKNLLHLAGANQGDPTSIAIIYFRGSQNPDDEDAGLRSLSQGQASLLLKSRDSEGLVGVPGKDLLAFVERTPMIESGLLRSSLFLGSSTSLAGADPVLVVDSQESLGIVPIAIRMDGEAAVGVWYTQRPYGIGGEILFDPLGGLWFLDLTTSTSSEVLSNSQSLLGFSPSQQWLAAGGRGPDQPDFQLVDLVSQEARSIQIKPENDRGAGMVVFSPGDTRLAWLEASGSLSKEDFHATLRVSDLKGNSVVDYPQEYFIKTAGLGQAVWLSPLGWLDETSLLVEVRSMGKDSQSVILRLDSQADQVSRVAGGTFCGFLYP